MRRIVRQRELLLLVFILLVVLATVSQTSLFLTKANLNALFLAMSVNGLVAIGMTILLVSGGFDLSVGSMAALSGVVAGVLFSAGANSLVAVGAAVACGVVVGLTNGVLISKVGLNPLVCTLAMLSILRGLVYVITGGSDQTDFPESFTNFGQGTFLGWPLPVWYLIGATIAADVLLRRWRPLRRAFFIGANESASRALGIPVDRAKISYYVVASVLAAIAGLVLAARVGAATTTAGTGMELAVIAGVVIGGASLSGGEGSVIGSFLGVLLLTLINNVLGLLGVDTYWQVFVAGAVLMLAVLLDRIGERLRSRSISSQVQAAKASR
jgi:ribose transport system permease protein